MIATHYLLIFTVLHISYSNINNRYIIVYDDNIDEVTYKQEMSRMNLSYNVIYQFDSFKACVVILTENQLQHEIKNPYIKHISEDQESDGGILC